MYDLMVLSFNQRKRKCLRANNINIKALNSRGHKKQKYYRELWPFINNSYGILYKLFTSESLGKFECCDEMFEFGDTCETDIALQRLISNTKNLCAGDWVPMKLNDSYKEEFVRILDTLLSTSPTSTIAFLCRGQSLDEEVIVGAILCSDFVEMLRSGNIKTNICYIVKGTIP